LNAKNGKLSYDKLLETIKKRHPRKAKEKSKDEPVASGDKTDSKPEDGFEEYPCCGTKTGMLSCV